MVIWNKYQQSLADSNFDKQNPSPLNREGLACSLFIMLKLSFPFWGIPFLGRAS